MFWVRTSQQTGLKRLTLKMVRYWVLMKYAKNLSINKSPQEMMKLLAIQIVLMRCMAELVLMN